MKNPLDSLWGTVISGFVLTLILFWVDRAWFVSGHPALLSFPHPPLSWLIMPLLLIGWYLGVKAAVK